MISHIVKLQDLLDSIEEREQLHLSFSEWWLDDLKQRWNLRVFKSNEEPGDSDTVAFESDLPELQKLISNYSLRDSFNVDECGLFYSMASGTKIRFERLLECKKAKKRITTFPCANADGSETIELMIIGSSWKPRAFNK